MVKILILLVLLSGCTTVIPLQKGNILAVQHLLEAGEFIESKNVLEAMTAHPEMSQWPRTWYLRGVLCQSAYTAGIEKRNRRLMELYPDQLFEAFMSFEKARELDENPRRMKKRLAPRYIQLINKLQNLGERHYAGGRFSESLRAFEQAILISQSAVLLRSPSKELIYNSALAAIKSNENNKALKHLSYLHNIGYSTNVSHLLSSLYLGLRDTTSAIGVLKQAIQFFGYHESTVLLLVDLYHKSGMIQDALRLLENASEVNTGNYKFLFAKGLVYQKNEQYERAIDAYRRALQIEPGEPILIVNIATCYFNIGVGIEQSTRMIADSRMARIEKARSDAAFASALYWLEKIDQKTVENPSILLQIRQLYGSLGVTDGRYLN